MENNTIEIDIEKKLISAQGVMNMQIKTMLKPGEMVALYGSSGAGKTTLLRIIAGLTNPDKGILRVGNSIWFDSERKIQQPPMQRNIGFMFQDYALFPNMTVFENIAFAQKKKDPTAVNELLSKFGLQEFCDRKPIKLSGGQKQRVALARAIAGKPDILLLDEPLSALDSGIRSTLQEEIAKAHELSHSTTLLVSHDLAEVFRLAKSVLMMENGRIIKTGRPEDIFINNNISGKVQITGSVVRIEKHDTFFVLTVVTGMNQVIKVTAFADDVEELHVGDLVMVFSKAFNPFVMKI